MIAITRCGPNLPAEHDPSGRFVGKDARPAALAAVFAAIEDVSADVGLEHSLGDG